MGSLVLPQVTAIPASSSSSGAPQALLLIGLSLGIFVICCIALAGGFVFIWVKSKRQQAAFARRQVEEEAARKLDGSEKRQVRLPVVVIQPDNYVEHARAESRFFPCWATKGPSQGEEAEEAESQEPELPHTPNKGAYYIEGTPGYFECDVEMNKPSRTPTPTPRASSSTFLASPRGMINAAISLMTPRISSRLPEQPPNQPAMALETSNRSKDLP